MITKERLVELIEQGATIYGKIYGDILAIELSKKNKPEIKYDDRLDVYCTSNEWRNKMQFCYLCETKEEAEWELEFGNITRTETLKLPKWEEFNKNSYFQFVSKDMSNVVLAESSYLEINEYIDGEFVQTFFHKEMNKENYIEACKLAKKLFLGEEV